MTSTSDPKKYFLLQGPTATDTELPCPTTQRSPAVHRRPAAIVLGALCLAGVVAAVVMLSLPSSTTSHDTSPHSNILSVGSSSTTCRACDGSSGHNCCTHTLYVDAHKGSDSHPGTKSKPFASIRKAAANVKSNSAIFVASGTYHNTNFGTGKKGNGPAVSISNVDNVVLTNLPGHNPRIKFDGSAGVSVTNVNNIEISGLEIDGPNQDIAHSDAMADRLKHSNYFSGRGIVTWGGSHVHIHDNTVCNCPNSGIRVNRGDYITIEDNVVCHNTWWSSNAESALVLAESKNVDTSDAIKMVIRRNSVYGNINKIPYYNEHYDDPEYMRNHQMHVAREHYGSSAQTFIIDGSGVYISRNSDTYKHGRFELSDNTCHGNGINGLVVHKTNRVDVRGNVLYENGAVSTSAPELRQSFAGLVVTHSNDVTLTANKVKTTLSSDFAYALSGSSSSDSIDCSNNKVCHGKVDSGFSGCVKTNQCSGFPN